MHVGYVKADAQATRHFPVNLAVTSEDNITFTSFAKKKKKGKTACYQRSYLWHIF